jgi:hypothetical protein
VRYVGDLLILFHGMAKKVSFRCMDSVSISLSARSLGTPRVRATEDNFTFVVGGRRYCFPLVAAEFLSPRVRALHAIDATTNELLLAVDNDNNVFGSLIPLSQGAAVSLSQQSAAELLPVCAALSNWELAGSIERLLNPSQTADAAIGRLLLYSQTPSDLGFLASRFCELAGSADGLGISMLSEIISHPTLHIESEDWLYDYIIYKMEQDSAFISLFEFLEFKHISRMKMSEFIDRISGSEAELNISIYRKLLGRLVS